METPATPPRKTRPWLIGLIVFVLAFDLAYFWQHRWGAYQSEFGGHPDEAAHVVTGLFVRDAIVEGVRYVTGGGRGSLLSAGKEYAGDYYAHYPKIGLGVWPPFFYLVQSAWTLPLGASRTTLLLMMAALAAGLGLLVFRALREEFGTAVSALGAAIVLSLPLVRSHYGMVMAETLSALLMFGAMLAFGNFLDRERRADALWFGVLAALAILTKGTGLALALAAPLALLFTRKFHLLKRPALWSAVLIVVIVAGPWTWATRHLGKGGWLQPELSWPFTFGALPYYAGKLHRVLGPILLMLVLAGIWAKTRRSASQRGRWAAATALLVAVPVFQSIAPVGLEARHLIPALPAACVLAVAGFEEWRTRLQIKRPQASWPVFVLSLVCVVSLTLAIAGRDQSVKAFTGFAPLAEAMLAEAAPAEVTLVSSDATGEGAFIAEVALRERRPGHTIQRASKSLATSTWSGSGYTPAFAEDQDALAFLTRGEIRYLVLDASVPRDKRRAHHDQLQRLVEEHADRFQLIAETELWRGGEPQPAPLKLYQISRKN